MPGTGTLHTLIVPNDSLELDGTYYGVGAFIYRSELSDGTFDADSVKLKWNYGLNGFTTLPEDIELHVYGTEMVYIPEGPFAFGDGGSSWGRWWLKDNPYDFVYIGDYLAPLMIGGADLVHKDSQATEIGLRIHGIEGLDWDGDGQVENKYFPTGYKAFYIMKYETSQGQYADFLNSLTQFQVTSANLYPDLFGHRFEISKHDGVFLSTKPDRACNMIIHEKLFSLADWMGLRPMTRFEFEKSARGPISPILWEASWGMNFQETHKKMDSLIGEENGTEYPNIQEANYHNISDNIIGGDGSDGPLRVGIFAGENTNRIQSGASYYGVMDLTSNLYESYVNIGNNRQYRRGFRYYPGDGELSIDGKSDSFLNKSGGGILVNFFSMDPDNSLFVYWAKIYNYTSYSWGAGWDDYKYIGARYVRNAPNFNIK
jgi:formylglycine-generating enzyme required for sulfatase activity